MIEEFKQFVLRGNVLDLAVAFVMGAAFNGLVMSLVSNVVTPIIGIPGHVNFSTISYTVNGSTIMVGAFLNALLSFIIISLAVFFFIVKPVSKLSGMGKQGAPAKTSTKACKFCKYEIPLDATRCPFCTSKL
ncbi:MAG: large conductance mechanosensitive channel protein MscL [Candidatus Micrarchaeota archaeon]|nr:large conductance mechanosensitive channel protein MscL [Candidatus Micrarchaeota archaeon]MDE1834918.1 large conductance mechanosensitive channel protein MscL [Candidatus Micrarchaeota archaeon]MDE1859112.1 large conductance mechanosensitive channel protein MscL [Candidatus Micrarchaeota archaeon]